MKKWRMIESGPANAPDNMAIDEALFCEQTEDNTFPPTIRIYSWTEPCMTIGYFQKYSDFVNDNVPVIRRLTGGLSVLHGNDISYAFIVNAEAWPQSYNQEKTYELIHSFIKNALLSSGIPTEFVSSAEENFSSTSAGNICVKTLYKHDLKSGNKKIVGSCQRRRGKNLLVQGSIHLPLKIDSVVFCGNLKDELKNHTGCQIETGFLSEKENAIAGTLAKEKYSNPAWNHKY